MLVNGRGSWKLRASPARLRSCAVRPFIIVPSKRTVPVSLTSVPQMQFTSVDLPEPFGPISPTRSPGETDSAMASSATKPPKRLPRPSTSSSGAAITCPSFAPLAQSVLHQPDDPFRRDDHEGHEQESDDEHVELGRDGHGRPLLKGGHQDRADQRADPARG